PRCLFDEGGRRLLQRRYGTRGNVRFVLAVVVGNERIKGGNKFFVTDGFTRRKQAGAADHYFYHVLFSKFWRGRGAMYAERRRKAVHLSTFRFRHTPPLGPLDQTAAHPTSGRPASL